jgi:predicted secreted protein
MQSFDDPTWAIRVAVDETFAVELAGNPTTGYTWQADIDPKHLELIEQEFEPSAAGIGAGGREVFRFHAQRAGTTEIRFVYRRPWGGPAQDQRRFRVVIA